jgi:antitoxin PrlF
MNFNTLSGRVTSKGQVTIPIEIRTALNIEEGDRIEFITDPEKNIEVKVIKKRSLNSVFGKLSVGNPIPFDEERERAHFNSGYENLSKDSQGDSKL